MRRWKDCDTGAVAAMQILLVAQPRHRGTQVRLTCVPELQHEGMAFECLLDDAALDALAAAMDQSDFAQASLVCGADILLNDRLDVARIEGVEIERRFDRHPMGHGAG